jgi:protein-S-isoprenylcysteine O-methyltransferase Ste14
MPAVTPEFRIRLTQLSIFVIYGAWLVGPFLAAGSFGWVPGWAALGALAVVAAGHQLAVRLLNPGLVRERQTVKPDTEPWDLAWNVVFWALMASGPVLAGLEARQGAEPGSWLEFAAGCGLLVLGFSLSGWAMASNPFFEPTVRLQKERGQTPVDTGPYATIRHPGYAGLALWALATPLLLRSAWAWAGALASVAWLVVRTAREDRFLKKRLAGYGDYASRVPFRLVPGVW